MTVPFRPRADDTWEVDGEAPKGLPAGHASGREMREAPEGSAWAKGAPGRTEAAGRLVQLYVGWGKPDEAARWKKELEAQEKKVRSQGTRVRQSVD